MQSLLGHESLATTGIYTQLADTMTKEIAMNTPTALDAVLPAEERMLKEQMAAYEAEYEEWDALVVEVAR